MSILHGSIEYSKGQYPEEFKEYDSTSQGASWGLIHSKAQFK